MLRPPPSNLLGFVLSLIAALMWGILPIALKELLAGMDAGTIVWYRFAVAGVVLGLWLALTGRLPGRAALTGRSILLLGIATLGLSGNYLLFSYSLNYINAETTEAVIQLTTLFLILGGVLVYGEPFLRVQKIGTGLIVLGLVLFFNERFAGLMSPDNAETLGVFIVVLAAITWTVYALIQKQLLSRMSSVQILTGIYLASTLLILPFVTPATLLSLNSWHLALLAFCCLNTLVAYGCFAEALNRWEASKVSATLALAPLFTIAGLKIIVAFNPDYAFSDRLSLLSLFGAALLVLGSALTALVPLFYERRRSLAQRSAA